MKISFAIFKYFPYGGLQRDMMRMAMEAVSREHEVVIYTSEWDADMPSIPRLSVVKFNLRSISNHGRAKEFERLFNAETGFDLKVVFNRMAGGDLYFAADNCLAEYMPEKYSALTLRFHPRYRTFLRQERDVCARGNKTEIMYITSHQKRDFQKHYSTEEERFHYLPPGLENTFRCNKKSEEIRALKRSEFSLSPNDLMLIQIGSSFKGKGIDRSITALASLPDSLRKRVVLFIVGTPSENDCVSLASKLGVRDNIRLIGARNDVFDLLLAADLMIHPARNEATGTVLVEAIAAALPMICSEDCGFCNFVSESGGHVIPKPFNQNTLNEILLSSIGNLQSLIEAVQKYAVTADIYRRHELAVDLMEKIAHPNRH